MQHRFRIQRYWVREKTDCANKILKILLLKKRKVLSHFPFSCFIFEAKNFRSNVYSRHSYLQQQAYSSLVADARKTHFTILASIIQWCRITLFDLYVLLAAGHGLLLAVERWREPDISRGAWNLRIDLVDGINLRCSVLGTTSFHYGLCHFTMSLGASFGFNEEVNSSFVFRCNSTRDCEVVGMLTDQSVSNGDLLPNLLVARARGTARQDIGELNLGRSLGVWVSFGLGIGTRHTTPFPKYSVGISRGTSGQWLTRWGIEGVSGLLGALFVEAEWCNGLGSIHRLVYQGSVMSHQVAQDSVTYHCGGKRICTKFSTLGSRHKRGKVGDVTFAPSHPSFRAIATTAVLDHESIFKVGIETAGIFRGKYDISTIFAGNILPNRRHYNDLTSRIGLANVPPNVIWNLLVKRCKHRSWRTLTASSNFWLGPFKCYRAINLAGWIPVLDIPATWFAALILIASSATITLTIRTWPDSPECGCLHSQARCCQGEDHQCCCRFIPAIPRRYRFSVSFDCRRMSISQIMTRGGAARIFGCLAHCSLDTITQAIGEIVELFAIILTVFLAAVRSCLNRDIAAAFLQILNGIARVMNGTNWFGSITVDKSSAATCQGSFAGDIHGDKADGAIQWDHVGRSSRLNIDGKLRSR